MNVTKRNKKPSFLKVFERRDEKEDNPLLHASSASLFSTAGASSEELGLPPLFSSSLLATAEEGNEDAEEEEDLVDFVLSKYDDDDDGSTSMHSSGHAAANVKSSSFLEEIPPETTKQRSASDSHVLLPTKFAAVGQPTSFASEGTTLPDPKMDSQILSEHSDSLTMHDDVQGSGSFNKDDGIIVDNSVAVPDSLVRHARAASAVAASTKSKEKRTSRLLSGAKGLLRVGKGSTSPKAHKVELEAAVRKVSAGESAKSFAQFSLEEIGPAGVSLETARSATELLTTRDDLDNNDSDDDSDDQSKVPKSHAGTAIKRPSTLMAPSVRNLGSTPHEEAWSSDEEAQVETVETSDGINVEESTPRRSSERRSSASAAVSTTTDDADKEAERRARRRNQASKSVRHISAKESSGSARRDRQRSVRSTDTTSSKESGDSHSRRRTLHRSREGHAEKNDSKAEGKGEASSHRSSRQDHKSGEIKTKRERSDRLSDRVTDSSQSGHRDKALTKHHSPKGVGVNPCESNDTSETLVLSPTVSSIKDLERYDAMPPTDDHDAVLDGARNAAADGPRTPQTVQPGRLSDLIKKDRASKTAESPVKRRSFGKTSSDRFLSAAFSPGMETISSTAAVSKVHKKVTGSDDLRIESLAPLDVVPCETHVTGEPSKEETGDQDVVAKGHRERSPRRKSRLEHGTAGLKSPSKSIPTQGKADGVNVFSQQIREGLAGKVRDDVSLDLVLQTGESNRQLEDHGVIVAKTAHLAQVTESGKNNSRPSIAANGETSSKDDPTKSTEEKGPPTSVSDVSPEVSPRRGRQRSATSYVGRSPVKGASSPKPSMNSTGGAAILSKSPSKSSAYVRRGNRSLSNFAEATDDHAGPPSPSNESKLRLMRRSRSPVPHQQHQDMVFTWKRNTPARATIAATRRTARMAILRQGSNRALEDGPQISDALAKAFTPVGDAPATQMRGDIQPTPVADVLSEELREEFHRLSAELAESKARVLQSKTATLRLQEEIAELQVRLDRVEERKRG